MTKQTKFPSALISGDCATSSLVLDGGSIIDQCIVTAGERGTFFLEQHLLYVVLEGSVRLTNGRQEWIVGKNQMLLLRRAQSIGYEKTGAEETGVFESLLFGINDDILKDFLTSQQVHISYSTEELHPKVSPMSNQLVAYCHSLTPYFVNPSQVNPALLRLKVMELLFNVIDCSKNIFRQILQLRSPVRADIHRVVEEHYTSPLSLKELAYLSGRSISSFKRDFQSIYGESPAKWIREKRLSKAYQMLQSSQMSVSDVAYSLGFENTSHFSRIFKQRYGTSPSAIAGHA
ncbi:MAG: AraC family transcriptional regulator [Bacteroidales bacterium]|nr:AraC family transcriptional regulator [Bacteroidales bacterium]MBQ9639869.1 AraC family transcriptional regulator [Bacteroidales bacterium]